MSMFGHAPNRAGVMRKLPRSRSAGVLVMFFATSFVTVAILLWMFQLVVSAESSTSLSPIFFHLFAAFDHHAAALALLILIAAILIPEGIPTRRLLVWLDDHVIAIAASTAAMLCVGTLVIYQNHPLCMDEYAALFQSQVFAAGHLSGYFPPALIDWLLPTQFQNYFFAASATTGEVVSLYWPSFALLLTPFTWMGIPWAANPLLSAASLLTVHRLTRNIIGNEEASGLAVLLMIASPVFFANGISYYSMPAHLLANSVYALLLLKPTRTKALVAGFVGSIALTLHNPVPHLLFALPWLVWVVTRPGGARVFACLCTGYAPLCLILGVGWYWHYSQIMNGNDAVVTADSIVGIERLASAFSLPDADLLLARIIGAIKVWLWAVPGLVLLAFAGAWKRRRDRSCQLLVISMITTFAGYLFVPVDQGHGWGFRYFHSAWFGLPILAAAALAPLKASAATERGMFEDAGSRTFMIACALLTITFGVSLRGWQIHGFISEHLAQAPHYAVTGGERHVVIVDTNNSFYGEDLIQNDPWLRTSTIRVISRGRQADSEMMRAHFPAMNRIHADAFGSVWADSNAADN